MNRRFLTSVTAVAILLGTSGLPLAVADAATSTTQTSPEARLQRFKDALAQLDLKPEQKAKIKAIWQETKTKLLALKNGGGVDKSEARPIIKAAIEKTIAVLTPGQKMKLKEILKATKA